MHFPPFSRGSILGSTLGSILGGPTFVVSPRLFKTGSQFQDKISNPQSTIEYSKFQNRDNTPEFRWHNEFQMARAKIQLARRILNGTPNFEWHAKKFLARKSCDGTLARNAQLSDVRQQFEQSLGCTDAPLALQAGQARAEVGTHLVQQFQQQQSLTMQQQQNMTVDIQ